MFGLGPFITDDRSLAKAPGSGTETKGSLEDILKDVDVMLKAPRFARWMGSTNVDQKMMQMQGGMHDLTSITSRARMKTP